MEVKCLIYILFGVGFALTMEFLFNDNLSRYYSPKLKFETIISDANIFFYLIGIPATIFLYTALYILVSDIKNVFNSGIYESCIKKSLIGKFFLKLFKKLNSTFSKLMSFDISNTKNRKLMLVLGINLIIVWIIVFFTSFVFLYIVFGIGGSYSLFGSVILGMCIAIIYSLFIFSYLKDRMCELEQLYIVTDEISLGNFNQHMELNLGIFNPILEKLNSISEGFKIAVDEEIKSQNLKTELISNVSHDLKTPLTSIISYIDLLKKENDMSETQKEYIEILEQKSQRLTLLIEDLFEASKAASGNISFNKSSLDLVSLLRQTIAENENDISASGLLFKIQLPDSEQKIICKLDGKRTYRIFDNLISNILKYSLPSSRVYIDMSLNMNKVLIVFKNISAYEMNFNPNDIAERFVRGDKSRNTDGSGLGLSIAKSFTELQGGEFNGMFEKLIGEIDYQLIVGILVGIISYILFDINGYLSERDKSLSNFNEWIKKAYIDIRFKGLKIEDIIKSIEEDVTPSSDIPTYFRYAMLKEKYDSIESIIVVLYLDQINRDTNVLPKRYLEQISIFLINIICILIFVAAVLGFPLIFAKVMQIGIGKLISLGINQYLFLFIVGLIIPEFCVSGYAYL